MPANVALLRGINVGGRTLKMDLLREIALGCGFTDVSTYIQSGNVLLRSPAATEEIARTLQAAILDRSGIDSRVVVRTAAELHELTDANPWPERVSDPTKVSVLFLYPEATPTLDRVDPSGYAPDEVWLRGREAFLSTPLGMGKSTLVEPMLKRLGLHGTVRNWRTVLTLRDLLVSMG